MAASRPCRVTGLVLAAGGSSRLGRPKQLLPFRGATLLSHVLGVARGCGFDQTLCVLGGAAAQVRAAVDLSGVQVVENPGFGSGCSSSIAAAMPEVDAGSDVLVLMLGDQPGVTAETVATLLDGRGDAALAACRYDDGRGHPLAFARSTFRDLKELHGDKAVWRLLAERSGEVVDIPVTGAVPRDVDTWADYRSLIGARPVEY
jgi:molybdenum cofactor cytidylyltransferase